MVTAETTCKRIREKYFEATLRQNIGFFDELGAGEVATRIESDAHLVQDGIGDKIPISGTSSVWRDSCCVVSGL